MKQMKHRKMLAILLAVSLLTAMLTACSSGGSQSAGSNSGTEVVHLWASGSDNVRQIFQTLTDNFNGNEEYNQGKYQIELNFILSGTGQQSLTDMLAAAYEANQTSTDYDLVECGDDDVNTYIQRIGQDAFITLDKTKIPNASSVKAVSASGPDIAQPYRGTTVVLAYNSKTVTDVPTTADELYQWIEDHPGRFAYNSPGTGGAGASFVSTTVYNLMPEEAATSSDEKWMEQWDAGFQKLAELHPYMYKSGGSVVYPNKNQGALDLLANGEIDMCPMWDDMLLSQRAAGTVPEYIKMTTITPSFTGSLVDFVMPKFGSQSDGAYAFINYVLSDEAQEILVKQMAAIPLVDTSNMDLTGYEDITSLDVSQFRTISIGTLGSELTQRWDNEIGTLE